MKRALTTIFGLCLLGAAAGLGAPGTAVPDHEFDAWKNRPHEEFKDGEAMFQKAKALLLKEYYRAGLGEADAYRAAVAGMLEKIDPDMAKWNRLLSPTEVAELDADTSGEIVGAGVEIRFDSPSGYADVLSVVPGAPAEKAGVRAGDKILKVDGKFFQGQQLRDVVYAIRGREGDSRKLTLLRRDEILTRTVRLRRVPYANVEGVMLPGRIALVSVRYFSGGVAPRLRAVLESLAKESPRALLVDLRGNQGGLLSSALDSASLFVPRGKPIVRIVKREGEETKASSGDPIASGIPVAVLVNGDTASGAEVVAAALKESLGARVVGTKTEGKWSVQSVETLPNRYAVKYTVGKLLSGQGSDYAGKGLAPDIEVAAEPGESEKVRGASTPETRLAADAQLRAAVAVFAK